MQIININCSKKYKVIMKRGLTDRLAEILNQYKDTEKVCIVTDKNISNLYKNKINNIEAESKAEIITYIINPGETSKSGETYLNLMEFLADNQLTRTDIILAFGGGVVGDLAGFAAATYLRGIRFIQVPTTLLAAVDSSVGGKTAINLKAGKNLAGAFYQPEEVICDPDMFDTLPQDVRRDGFAEIIKYGIIKDRELFEKIEQNADIEYVLERSIKTKAEIVESDEFDRKERRLLNLGHTFGHAIEIASDYSYSHGEAVAAGIVIISKAALIKGFLRIEEYQRIKNLIESFGFRTNNGFSADELYETMLLDKKRHGSRITLAVPYSIGDTRLMDVSLEELKEFAKEGLER